MVRFVGIPTAVVVLIVLLVSACGDASSGIEGIAVSSGGPPLADTANPIANAEVLVHENDAEGRVVGTVVTDADGRFKLEVEPGTYFMALTTAKGYPVHGTADVTSGQYTQVELTLPMK